MGWLANHVAKLPRLAVFAIEQDSVDVAQLGVYLRLNNIPVPAIYGPSAGGGVL